MKNTNHLFVLEEMQAEMLLPAIANYKQDAFLSDVEHDQLDDLTKRLNQWLNQWQQNGAATK